MGVTAEFSLHQNGRDRVKLASMTWSRREVLATLPAAFATNAMAATTGSLAFVGTYTRENSKGIYAIRLDPATGKLSTPELAVEVSNPSFLTIHPSGKFLYSVSEGRDGNVSAFSLDAKAGKLTLINSSSSKGSSPCHLVVDKTGKNLLVVNYGNGISTVLPVKADGSLGEATSVVQHKGSSANERRQKGPHAHSVNLSKNNKWAVVADLGTDEFIVYAFDAAKGAIERHGAAKVKPGMGPRHFNFHPNGKLAYGVCEMGSTVYAFGWDENKGELTELQNITTLPSDFKGENNCAEILVHPNGKFVYASNRGHDSLAVYQIEGKGTLKSVDYTSTQGKTPRNFRIDPTGKWLLAENQDSASVVVFKIDSSSGKLTPTGDKATISFPVCIRFV